MEINKGININVQNGTVTDNEEPKKKKETTKKKRNKIWVIILDIIFSIIVTVGIGIFLWMFISIFYEYFTYVPPVKDPNDTGFQVNIDTSAIGLIVAFIASIVFYFILAIQFVIYSILSIVTGILRRWHFPLTTITHGTLVLLNTIAFFMSLILISING